MYKTDPTLYKFTYKLFINKHMLPMYDTLDILYI